MTGATFRIEQIQSAMDAAGIDAVVLRLAENVVLATDWYVQIPGLGFVVIGRSGGATLLVPEYEAEEASASWPGDIRTFPAIRNDGPAPGAEITRHLGDLAREHGAAGGVIGFEGSFESVAPGSIHGEPNAVGLPTQALLKAAFGSERLADFSEPLEAMRSVKTERDLERLQRTNEIAVFGLNAFKEASVPGATEVEVMAAVEHAISTKGHGHKGARWVRGFCTIYSGPDLGEGWKYWRARTRRIEAGDSVMLELGTVADGYWSDHTRTVCAGKATPEMQAAYDAMRAGRGCGLRRREAGRDGRRRRPGLARGLRRGGVHAVPPPHRSRHGLPLPRVAAAARSGRDGRAAGRERDHHRAGDLLARGRLGRPARGQRGRDGGRRGRAHDDRLPVRPVLSASTALF